MCTYWRRACLLRAWGYASVRARKWYRIITHLSVHPSSSKTLTHWSHPYARVQLTAWFPLNVHDVNNGWPLPMYTAPP